LSETGITNISVYNLLGQQVATILNEELPAGRHSVNFNASSLSSGVYFYSIESGKNVATMKMMLLK